jgi:hypothetical protein
VSVRILSWVWDSSRSEGTDRLVLLALADQARDDGTTWPSVETIALRSRVSERTVQRSIKALQLLGELAVEANAGTRGTNKYTVIVSPRQIDTPDNLTPVSQSPRQIDGVTPMTRSGDTRVTRTVKNHQLPPNPPAPRGGIGAPKKGHCPRHALHRASCRVCLDIENGLANERALLAIAIAKCPDCEGMGFLLDDDKRPTKRKCNHETVLDPAPVVSLGGTT